MKKFMALLLSAIIAAGLPGCGTKNNASSGGQSASQGTPSQNGQNSSESQGKMKLGLALSAHGEDSSSADEDGDGKASIRFLTAAVLTDEEGKILSCVLDEAEGSVSFDRTGKITSESQGEIPTKKERQEDYGMKKASSIGREWYEQAEYFASYLKGKNLSEIRGISVDEAGYPTGEDLRAGCTVKISDYIDTVAKAMEQAENFAGKAEDSLSLGAKVQVTTASGAAEDTDGKIVITMTAAAAATDSSGKITGCLLDSVQGEVRMDTSGKVTQSEEEYQSKKELQYEYGMKKASDIGKEWFEQAKGFEEYVLGKTAFEVSSISVDENTSPTDGDLSAVCTIKIGDFQDCIDKAIGKAAENGQ